jgi:hypothetical protein
MRTISFSLLLLSLTHAAELRSWTDIQNRKIEATLLRVEDKTVIFKLKNGSEIPYPMAKLSLADCKYLEELIVSPTSEKTGQSLNFDQPWPERIKFSEDPEVNTVEEDAEKKRFIYESANYRYVCDVRLAKSVVKGFAVMFEATHLYCRSLPLAINGGKAVDNKHQILLFEKIDD